MDERIARCTDWYQQTWQRYREQLGPGVALDECLHRFLDQQPGQKLTNRQRAIALGAAGFWREAQAVNASELAGLALGRILHFEDAIALEVLLQLAEHCWSVLEQGIRFSRLFERQESALWQGLCRGVGRPEWRSLRKSCTRLVEDLRALERSTHKAEKRLKDLSLFEQLSYLSVLAFEPLVQPGVPSSELQATWNALEQVVMRKLTSCSERDFALTDERLGRSMASHLAPMILPGHPHAKLVQCRHHLASTTALLSALQVLEAHRSAVDAFCFGAATGNDDDWVRTETKYLALQHYWLNRGHLMFACSELADVQMGTAKNHPINRAAYILALRSQEYLNAAFGMDRHVRHGADQIPLFFLLHSSELIAQFYNSEFTLKIQRYYQQCGSIAGAFGLLALDGFMEMENRLPIVWSTREQKVGRLRDWAVHAEHLPDREAQAAAMLDFWTCDLQQLASQVQQTPEIPLPRLNECLFYRIGDYYFQFPWITGQQNNLTAAANNLRRLKGRRPEVLEETRRIEQGLADALRDQGFAVEVSYQPPHVDGEDAGEIDLICHRDGILLLLEVKSGYIRSSYREVWLHRTSTLRKAARQLKRKREALQLALQTDSDLCTRLGWPQQLAECAPVSWIVDTSIELDGQLVDGFRVVSREVIEVALRDDAFLLREFTCEEDIQPFTLYPQGFTAARFVQVIESEAIWHPHC